MFQNVPECSRMFVSGMFQNISEPLAENRMVWGTRYRFFMMLRLYSGLVYTHEMDDAISCFGLTFKLRHLSYVIAISLKMTLVDSPKNSLSKRTGFMRQMWQKPIFANFPNFLAPIFALFCNLMPFFETNRGGHPLPFNLHFDELSYAKNPMQIGWILSHSQPVTHIYIYLGRQVFSSRILRISALGKTGRKFKKGKRCRYFGLLG